MNNTPTPTSEEPTPAEMEAFNNFDPVHDIPSPFEIIGTPRITAQPTLSSFSPGEQKAIMERAGGTSEAAIQNAIHAHLIDKRRGFLIKAGAGAGSTETQRTMLEQANRVRQLKGDIDRIDEQLADVLEYRTEFDEAGRPQAVPVYRIQGDQRSAYQAEKQRLAHEMALIAGVQGERELRKANRADALAAREARQRVAEFREAERRAQEIARNERIERMAQAKAKFLRETNL